MDGTSPASWRPAPLPRALCCREPIYAQLVREWRDQGRAVPADPDGRWATVLVLAPRR
ncbi:hypothetical protein AB0M32_11770 [Streptomyces sp. NPDC051985]|uniref:hypothetical protein n=1 Tax=Streptomyces sp. NPDC051985 TaxID=3155807 RepID=UPI0034273465